MHFHKLNNSLKCRTLLSVSKYLDTDKLQFKDIFNVYYMYFVIFVQQPGLKRSRSHKNSIII